MLGAEELVKGKSSTVPVIDITDDKSIEPAVLISPSKGNTKPMIVNYIVDEVMDFGMVDNAAKWYSVLEEEDKEVVIIAIVETFLDYCRTPRDYRSKFPPESQMESQMESRFRNK